MFGTGQLPKFEEDQFEIKFDNSDQKEFLIPTASGFNKSSKKIDN